MKYYFLDNRLIFPPVEMANEHGILAIGGDLSVSRLLLAYQSGIFPWFSPGEPILWWAPDPRFVLYPEKLYVSKSMRQLFKKQPFEVTLDQSFQKVIANCRQIPRKAQDGTWITEDMQEAYKDLHGLGYAHSVEVWQENELVGGLYGVSLGRCFFGESMFAKVSNASKYGFIFLVEKLREYQFQLIDCQVYTDHLGSLGAELIPRTQFMEELESSLQAETLIGNWGQLFG
ncbi:MAG: leucyl/phenylalanyl-tRNA--protein transferase [Microscillaceae bacterium]|nr:leucyl/phenylalanyl-tRNA--protein transferase [Microscillaceae bacterium]